MLTGGARSGKAGEESAQHPVKDASGHLILVPGSFSASSQSAKITQLCPTLAQVPSQVIGAPLGATGLGERGVRIVSISNLCS